MKLHRTALGIALGTLALAVGLPAAALDNLSGTYEGKLRCRQTVAGVTTKSKQAAVVLVDQDMDGSLALDVSASGVPLAGVIFGRVVPDATRPNRGSLAAVECGLDVLSELGAMIHADAVVKPGSAKGSLKGTLIDLDASGSTVRLCTFKVKRTSTVTPPMSLCAI